MGDKVITSGTVLNYSGLLFNRGNTQTPFSVLIAGKGKTTNATEFVTGQEYETGGGEQPNISEAGSLMAPDSSFVTRVQKTNVTQIFQESVYISYGKESNMGTLAGVNVAGQKANPIKEIDFQVAARMTKIARDIEYTFLNGEYQKSTSDSVANRTRGILPAITSNVLDFKGKPLTVWGVAEAMKLINDSNAPLSDLVLWVDATSMFQLNADAEANGLTIVPDSREVNGIKLSTILTPLGAINIYLGQFLPQGTVGIFNTSVIRSVEQPHPEKGNFFMEELAKTGAGTKYQIFGQIGLDHGPEWYHAKIVNISPNFDAPLTGKKVVIVNDKIEIEKITLGDKPQVGQETEALDIKLSGKPDGSVSYTYQWQICNSPSGTFEDIESETGETYTPKPEDEGKYIRVEVTSPELEDTDVSNCKKVVV